MNLTVTCPVCTARLTLPHDLSRPITKEKVKPRAKALFDVTSTQIPLGYDVPVSVNVDIDELQQLAIESHERGLTVDEYIAYLATSHL